MRAKILILIFKFLLAIVLPVGLVNYCWDLHRLCVKNSCLIFTTLVRRIQSKHIDKWAINSAQLHGHIGCFELIGFKFNSTTTHRVLGIRE